MPLVLVWWRGGWHYLVLGGTAPGQVEKVESEAGDNNWRGNFNTPSVSSLGGCILLRLLTRSDALDPV